MTDTTGRNHKGKYERTLAGAQRDAEAARLRARGLTFQQIADQLGYSDRSAARLGWKRIIDGVVIEAREDVVKLELDKLDTMEREVLRVMETFHFVVSDGRIVFTGDKDDPERTPLHDDGPILAAIDRWVKISAHRAKLLGAFAPTRSEVVTLDVVDAEIRKLEKELAAPPSTG
jgi:hypothetical protein